ncbi:HU family DNA-binding protein [Persephonella sp.]
MKKSDLLNYLSDKFTHIKKKDLQEILNGTFEAMTDALSKGDKVEIRGLGSFKIKVKNSRRGRNPKTGEIVNVPEKRVVYFKMGKVLKRKLFSRPVG